LVVEPRSLAQQAVADGSPGLLLYCALIVETVDAQTRAKTGVNERLREWRAGTVRRNNSARHLGGRLEARRKTIDA
jgi:hypothetical protein